MPKIISVVSVFHPDVLRLNHVVKAISKQSDLIIVFNSPVPKDIYIPEDAIVVVNKTNVGVAKAYNQACSLAEQKKYDYVFILDQDSIPSENAIDALREIVKNNNLALLGLSVIDFNNRVTSNIDCLEQTSCVISSGSLVNLEILSRLGYFNEDFFIDHVDTEYCFRLAENSYPVFITNNARIDHQFGKPTSVKVGVILKVLGYLLSRDFGKFTRRNYPPVRIYYQYRNTLWLHRLYKHSSLGKKKNLLRVLRNKTFNSLFIEKLTLCGIYAILKGVFDGLFTSPKRKNQEKQQ